MHFQDPVSSATEADYEFQSDTSAYIDLLVQSLPATDHQLQIVREAQDSDATCTE